LDAIDSFINERILYAEEILINNAIKILSETREEIILVFGNEECQTIENILKRAHDLKTKKFQVIIVDSAPDYKGRNIAKRLSTLGIKCKYTLINMLNFLIN
jgi:translation initiation factor eIF-2B subunit delta